MPLQENLDTWILPLKPFLDQICQQFMHAVFTICVVGGNLSSGAAMKYSYIIEIAAIPPKLLLRS